MTNLNRLERLEKDIIENPEKINEQLFLINRGHTYYSNFKKNKQSPNLKKSFPIGFFYYNGISELDLNFCDFYYENVRKFTQKLAFDFGLSRSDYFIQGLWQEHINRLVISSEEYKVKNGELLKRTKNGLVALDWKEKYNTEIFKEKEKLARTVLEILIKNEEFEILMNKPLTSVPKGNFAYKMSNEIFDDGQNFKYNVLGNFVKYGNTKKELQTLQKKVINQFISKQKIAPAWNMKKIGDCIGKRGLRKESKEWDNLLDSIYDLQKQEHIKIIKYMSANTRKYIKLVDNSINFVKEDNKPYVSQSPYSDGWSPVGFSGSNGGPIGHLEKITKAEYLRRN